MWVERAGQVYRSENPSEKVEWDRDGSGRRRLEKIVKRRHVSCVVTTSFYGTKRLRECLGVISEPPRSAFRVRTALLRQDPARLRRRRRTPPRLTRLLHTRDFRVSLPPESRRSASTGVWTQVVVGGVNARSGVTGKEPH